MADATKDTLQPKSFSIEWTITSFFADRQTPGEYYSSSIFPIRYADESIDWSLQVYPHGPKEGDRNWLALFLHFQSKSHIEVTTDFQLSIVSKKNSYKLGKVRIFEGPRDNWGWNKFVEQSFIKDMKNGALNNDTLTILCEIKFPQEAQDIAEKLREYGNLLNRIEKGFGDYEKLLQTSNFSDVTFNIQGKKLHLHKAILSCRNPVFKAMFEHEMKEKNQSTVEISDVGYEIMVELFRFIYSGKVENIEELASDLLIAADKYSVIELKALCEKTLYENLTVDNAIECLKVTDLCDTIYLKTLAVDFVATQYKDIAKKPGLVDLNSNVLCQIIQKIAENN